MADITDKFTDVRNAARPNTAAVTTARIASGSTLACNSLAGWPTDSKVHFVIYQVDSSNNVVAGTQLDCSGIVSANSITQLEVIDGVDGGNSIGDIVEMLPTAAWGQDLADGLTEEHERTGVHNTAAVITIGSALYPVGSIYTNASVATNPATLLGFGTWTAFGSGRVMVGVSASDTEFDTLGETGGAKTHTLTTAQIPAHSHSVTDPGHSHQQMRDDATGASGSGNPDANWGASAYGPTSTSLTGISIQNAGGGTSHNNLQPYITVYLWQRTA